MAAQQTESSTPIGTIELIHNGILVPTQFYASDKKKGKELLAKDDEYFNNQSDFDRYARIGITQGLATDSNQLKKLYVSYVQNQVSEWTNEEISCLKTIIKNMNYKYKLLNSYKLPNKVYLVKTTGYEEGAAAYTRNLNTIVLPQNMVSSLSDFNSTGDPLHPAGNTDYLQGIVQHESFHVFSKNSFVSDKAHLASLYNNIGYQFTSNPIQLPDVKWPFNANPSEQDSMTNFRITNPDSPSFNTYIELDLEEKGKTCLTPLLMANSKYNGGAFFDYLVWYTIEVECKNDKWIPVLDKNGLPILHEMTEGSDIFNKYLEKIGYNLTNEIFQADEVLAQTFVNILDQNNPSQWVLNNLLNDLKS